MYLDDVVTIVQSSKLPSLRVSVKLNRTDSGEGFVLIVSKSQVANALGNDVASYLLLKAELERVLIQINAKGIKCFLELVE